MNIMNIFHSYEIKCLETGTDRIYEFYFLLHATIGSNMYVSTCVHISYIVCVKLRSAAASILQNINFVLLKNFCMTNLQIYN